jgi:hypothetical protein
MSDGSEALKKLLEKLKNTPSKDIARFYDSVMNDDRYEKGYNIVIKHESIEFNNSIEYDREFYINSDFSLDYYDNDLIFAA